MTYEVINEETDESHGEYETYDEAMGAVVFDRISDRFSIWKDGDYRVNCCVDFEYAGETDSRVLQGMGLLPATHPDNQPS